jgi:hypothetical protein
MAVVAQARNLLQAQLTFPSNPYYRADFHFMAGSDVTSMKAAIGAFAAEPNGGLLPSPAIFAIVPFEELMRLAAHYGLPTIYGIPLPPGSGALMSYSRNIRPSFAW